MSPETVGSLLEKLLNCNSDVLKLCWVVWCPKVPGHTCSRSAELCGVAAAVAALANPIQRNCA